MLINKLRWGVGDPLTTRLLFLSKCLCFVLSPQLAHLKQCRTGAQRSRGTDHSSPEKQERFLKPTFTTLLQSSVGFELVDLLFLLLLNWNPEM